jgi:heme/copper-type cytochrome/quinol oxidase subunit 4
MGVAKTIWCSQFLELIAATLGSVIFLASVLIASFSYYWGRSFDPREAVISRLQDPYQNPHGYLIAAAGTVVFALLTLPAARLFFLKLRCIHRPMARAGAGLIVFGLVGTIALGFLAPFSSSFDPSHVVLAMFVFLTLTAGLTICLGLAAWSTRRIGLWLAAIVQFAALSVLVYMAFAPDFPPERSLLSSLAFLEWVICLITGASILVLTALLQNFKPVLSPSLGSGSRDSEDVQTART